MKKAVTIIVFIIFAFVCKSQNEVTLDSLIVKYYHLANTSKDSNLYKEKFFKIFPDNFQLFDSIYGYTELDNGDAFFSPLYSVSCEHIDRFYATIDVVDATVFYKKIINISQNGHWESDGVNCFNHSLRELLLNNTEHFLKILGSYTDIKIKSFWHFFYIAIYYDHPLEIKFQKEVFEKIKKLKEKRILTLMKEQYEHDYNEYLKHKNVHSVSTSDFFSQIKSYDLSKILMTDTFMADEAIDFDGSISSESTRMIERAEILGFIDENYQRFQIHFISIIQNPLNEYEYFAYGKTKVEENICSFQGIIKITKSQLYTECIIPFYKQGFVESEVTLYEDSKQSSTGFFSGKLTTHFVIDDKGAFRYDALSFSSDVFSNNQFIGTWTSYKTKLAKKCNWGDYRIPESGNLDIGAGYFSVDDKYVKNGWENYKLAWGSSEITPAVRIKARQKEKEQWWK
jgi:hypothetical protein